MSVLKNWIHKWEINLSQRDRNRRAEPFTWGLEYLEDIETYLGREVLSNEAYTQPSEFLIELNTQAIETSDIFYTPTIKPTWDVHDNWLTFKSTVQTPYETNNIVYARYFPAKSKDKSKRPPVVIVLPQWNGDNKSHMVICKALNKLGLAAVRMSLPYHDSRRPTDQIRADYMVSPNIGRTIQACRQAVQDLRCILDWLEEQGYTRFGVIGTSIGSCIGFLSYAHDPRLTVGAFNHVSSYFADVVWTGLSTSHVKQKLEGYVTRSELRKYWEVISPQPYVHRLTREEYKKHKTLFISAKYDLTFLPHLSRQVIGELERLCIPHQASWLPCGHYTSGEFPFKFYDGYLMVNHLYKHLSAAI